MHTQVLPRTFQTTRWSLVQRANGSVDEEALRLLGVDEKGKDLRGKSGAAK